MTMATTITHFEPLDTGTHAEAVTGHNVTDTCANCGHDWLEHSYGLYLQCPTSEAIDAHLAKHQS